MDLTGKQIEILLLGEFPKLDGTCVGTDGAGVMLDTGDDGTAIAHKVIGTFVPWNAVRTINVLEARSPAEQEAKTHELTEKFRKMTLESAAAPSSKNVEILEQEDID